MRHLIRTVIDKLLSYGVVGLGMGTFIESLGIPFGSLAFQLGSGGLIKSGRTTFLVAFLVSLLGLIMGSIASYYIGYFGFNISRRITRKKSSKLMDRLSGSLSKSGFMIVLLSQLYGPARTWISIPAGAAKMNIRAFVLGTSIGGALYCAGAISLSVVLTRIVQDMAKYFLSISHLYAILAAVLAISAILAFRYYLKRVRNGDRAKY